MKRASVVLACILAGLAGARSTNGQAVAGLGYLVAGDVMNASTAEMMFGEAPDARQYADGNRAIHDGRWGDAVKIFEQVAAQQGEHAAGALYWKAYAQNKLGQSAKAIDTCAVLQTQFGKSGWTEDCGALEIEIRAGKGQPVKPQAGQSDELKLLALATQIQKDPKGARAQIEEIVQGDSSEQLKEGALFILGETAPELRYPQIVRIGHMEGDIRIARASTNEKSKNEVWETAQMNLPLAAGDSLVTGKGWAEIEFENASTIYLAPDSVLRFDDLHSTSGVPHSEIELLSGTITLHLDSLMPGETFFVRTPTNDLMTRYPQKAEMRVSSFVDGMAVASLHGGILNVPGGGKETMTPGKALFFNKDHALVPAPVRAGDFAEFDAWVAARHGARTEAMAEEMKESGLTMPVPGMADMKGQGRFYPCEPYGTCWEPNGGNGNSILAQGPATPPAPQSANHPTTAPAASPSAQEFFPCLPAAAMNWYSRNAQLARTQITAPGLQATFDPYAWAVCHSGWWIHRNHRYVWVAGHKMHHHPPVHWIKFGKTTAFVPIHPRDVKGQAPLNREHGFMAIHAKGGPVLSPIKFDSTHPVEMMKSPPREFRSEPSPGLARAEAPQMEMHPLRESVMSRAGTVAPGGGIPLRFDHQTGGFTAPHQVMQGGHNTTVFASVGHSGGGGGGYQGHAGGGSYGGGGSRGGGSSSGGGSGMHGGGTSGGASTSTAISVSSTSTSSTATSAPAASSHR